MRALWVTALGVGCSGAGGPDALRRAWLVDTIADDNRAWEGRWEALAAKYRAMADDPYDWLRGSLVVFLRDLDRPGTGRAPTGFVGSAETASVLLVGDLHPENVGTFLPGEGPGPLGGPVPLRLEVNDLDGAGFGPWLVDPRRAALGTLVLLDGAGFDDEALAAAAEAFAGAFVDVVEAAARGEPGDAVPAPGTSGVVLDHLLDAAADDGCARAELLAATRLGPTGRRFRVGQDGLVPLRVEQRAQVSRLLAAWDGPDGRRVLDVARRDGAGVASRPAVRYVVAWDRGDDGPDDDELLQLREVVDPPALPDASAVAAAGFDGNPERSVQAARLLWSRPDADVRLAGLRDGDQAFKVGTWSGFQRALDHERAARDLQDLRTDDAVAFAEALGAVAGRTTARTVTHEGVPALPAVWAELDGRREVFVDALADQARADLAGALRDHALFASALDAFGPLLGAWGR